MRTTARELEKALLARIAAGTYTPNTRMPTCEQLAAELGVNKNTVSKAYRALAGRGYLQTIAGRGTFVLTRPYESLAAVEEVSNLLTLAVREAKLAGISRAELGAILERVTASAYERRSRSNATLASITESALPGANGVVSTS